MVVNKVINQFEILLARNVSLKMKKEMITPFCTHVIELQYF